MFYFLLVISPNPGFKSYLVRSLQRPARHAIETLRKLKEIGSVPGRDGRAPKAAPCAPPLGVWTTGFLQACVKASRKTLILRVLGPSRKSGIGHLPVPPSYCGSVALRKISRFFRKWVQQNSHSYVELIGHSCLFCPLFLQTTWRN